jgi:K+ transporter
LQTYVLPAATVILILLFAIQPLGTARIGRAFGLIMLAWFLIIAALEGDHFWRAEVKVGFMEHPDVPEILASCRAKGADIDVDDVTYYVGSVTIVLAKDGKGIPHWQEALFATMGRNAARMSDYLHLPHDQVVEIGREIEI